MQSDGRVGDCSCLQNMQHFAKCVIGYIPVRCNELIVMCVICFKKFFLPVHSVVYLILKSVRSVYAHLSGQLASFSALTLMEPGWVIWPVKIVA